MIFLNKNTSRDIDNYNIFDANNNNVNNIEKNRINNINSSQNSNNQNIASNMNSIVLKIQNYEENNQNLIIQLKNILGDKKYNTLTYHEKYVLIRYLLEDIDKNIKEKFLNQSNSDKKVFINLILKYYRENIKYTGNNLNEFDYYYITLFTFFLNAKILFPQQSQYYTLCMLQMINNRINKTNELWNNKNSKLNDLEIIKNKIDIYKKTNKDIYENYKSSFTKKEFELMSLSQKCAVLRVVIDGILKEEYNNTKSKEIQKQIIIKVNKIYENISKLNNFSYDWFISVYNIFENHIKIQKLIEEYEKNNNNLINNIIDSIGNTEYNNLSLVKKYALLKCCSCDLSKKAYSLLNEKSRKDFICDICDDIKKYFYDSYSLSDIEEVSDVLITCYNQEIKTIEESSNFLNQDIANKNISQQVQQQAQPQVQQQAQPQVQQQLQQQVQQQLQQQVQPQAQQQNMKIDFKLSMPLQDDKIIYFAGYKNKDNNDITLYKMSKEKFDNNKEEFIKKYQILTYNNENKNPTPIIISEKYYNKYCNGSKNICLSMIKETLQDIKLSNIPNKIQAFKNVSTKK